MSPHDTLRDRLADAAAPTATPLPNPRQLRSRAVRHRNQRRALSGAAVLVAVTAVAVAGGTLLGPRTASLGPATPPPATTQETTAPAPTPSTSAPAPSTTAPASTTGSTTAGPPALEQAEAQAFVEGVRFEDEADWQADLDIDIFPVTVDTDATALLAHGCSPDRVTPDALVARTVSKSGAESGSVRQLALFPDADAAASAFAELREVMRLCHLEERSSDDGTTRIETSYVGGQLTLGDESFWVATRDVVVSSDDPDSVGTELFYATAALLVLDGNVVTVIDDPASSDETRATFVEEASVEWERLQEGYQPVLR